MDDLLRERYQLAENRIREICTERTVQSRFIDFFQQTAKFLCKTADIMEKDVRTETLEELRQENYRTV